MAMKLKKQQAAKSEKRSKQQSDSSSSSSSDYSSSDSEDDLQVKIVEREDPSQEYKRPELLEKAIKEVEAEVAAKQAEGEEVSEYESSSDSDEDDEARLLTPAMDSDILRTIAAIRAKDPRVYEQSHHLKKEPKEKKITLKDYERDILLEHGGFVEQEDKPILTHRQEQDQLKNAFKAALKDDDDDSEEEDGFLTKKSKSKQELEAEENDYRNFLLQQMKKDEHTKETFEEWSNYKNNPQVNEEDAFLMDYVLNRGWVDKGEDSTKTEALDKETEEEFLDDVDRFESKYNYRFEEEGSGQIITYARDIDGSVRRKQSKRAKQRERQKAKKQELKQQKEAEIKHQKNLKMQEIREKLKEINDITGVQKLGLEEFGLDDDFNPSQHDADMEDMYGDEFYAQEEGGEGEEIQKPVWEDDIDTTQYENEEDQQEEYQEEEDQLAKDKKKELKQLVDEYYKLNYEDVVGGDVFTRFKYVRTEPENFGLSNEEILLADDAALNKYMTMKALAPYRPPELQEVDMHRFAKTKKKKMKELEKHIKKEKKKVEKELKHQLVDHKKVKSKQKSSTSNKRKRNDDESSKSKRKDKKVRFAEEKS
ncbi:Protein KRI1 [Choanephora cucurbitarum]|uniref:Protein KRI1 n=1 Tax=Choanephora cucurbitarum TaxID=101091 RepID=A0A1C7N960_9FUNG|nr:Protein KRI1 [Choanephora cucurbitarum]